MTTRIFSVPNIPVAWSNSLIWGVALALCPMLAAQTAEARLGRGIEEFESGKYSAAILDLKAAQPKLPKIADYVAYYLASARVELKDFAEARKDLAVFHKLQEPSPLELKAVLLEAKALALAPAQNGSAAEGIKLLRERYQELPQPPGDFTLAQAYEAAGQGAQAAEAYQRVYYLYPTSDSASRAAKALEALRASLGAAYPSPQPQQLLERANQLLAARQYIKARAEFSAVAEQQHGEEHDLAAVGIGAADYLAKRIDKACPYLQSLEVETPQADAERLFYVAECSRRKDDEGATHAALQKLAKRYPDSPWCLKALLASANRYLLANAHESYEPLYRACYESFPASPEAAGCHWRVTWSAYLWRRKDAVELLREQVLRYPADPSVSSALYYLGRLAEGAKDYRAARAYYDKLAERYPGYYYGLLAKERLAQAAIARAIPAEPVAAFLNSVQIPARTAPEAYQASAATALRIERFRLLSEAGLPKLAEAELRFGARTDGQPYLLAMELATAAEAPHKGLRNMKSLVTDYFTIAPGAAPEKFWELLFPLPFRADLVRQAAASALDPGIVAGLVRQESEFNPRVISPANAYGLTQVVPATGRELARRAGIRGFTTGMLFQPSTNLRLGTTYLRSLLDQWDGKWEQTLASYNAGKSHVNEWIKWADFQEPAEFVETIPFNETRDYVQSVLRNAAAYRRIYGSKLSETPAPPVQKTSVRPAAKRKGPLNRS
jgi:soluble lytic murein transglycosylase